MHTSVPTTIGSPILFVIDDDASLRDDLVDFLGAEGYRAVGFASYEQLAPVSDLLHPHLVLLDLGLPGLDGLDVCRVLRTRWPGIGVVMLTSRSGVEHQQAGLQVGADAYLLKTATLPLVEATVASVLRRLRWNVRDVSPPEPPAVATGWVLRENDQCLQAPQGQEALLSVNEFRLVQATVLAKGDPVPRPVLLQLVGKEDTEINRRNLDAVISRIRAKVRRQTGFDLPLRASYANGYAFVPGRESDAAT